MAYECTLAILKPDGVEKNLFGEVVRIYNEAGLLIVDTKYLNLTRNFLEQFYAVHRDRPFFPGLISEMEDKLAVAIWLMGENAIEKVRALNGATDPKKAHPESIRGKWGEGGPRNVVHGSGSMEEAKRELRLVFGDIIAL